MFFHRSTCGESGETWAQISKTLVRRELQSEVIALWGAAGAVATLRVCWFAGTPVVLLLALDRFLRAVADRVNDEIEIAVAIEIDQRHTSGIQIGARHARRCARCPKSRHRCAARAG